MFFKKIYKNQKGFNLFTALVSLILISITLVLIFNMIKTEDTYLSLIEDQSSISDLITVSDLARADAFNLFVVGLREAWESHRSDPDNYISIGRTRLEQPWDVFVDDMITQIFFESGFQIYFTSNIINKLKFSQDPVGYSIGLEKPSEQDLKVVIAQMFEDAPTKADVVNCKQSSLDNCVGSFYLYLNAAELNEENIDKLPKVTIRRFKNNEVIQRPLFDKRIYKIYMPWRGFQAFKTVRRISFTPEAEIHESPVTETFNKGGLLDPIIHNTLEQAKVGVCDRGSCAPRTNLFETPNADGFNKKCNDESYEVKVSSSGIKFANNNVDIKLPGDDPYNYKLSNYAHDSEEILNKLVNQTTKSVLNNLPKNDQGGETFFTFNSDLKMVGSINGFYNNPTIKINDIEVKANSLISKNASDKQDSLDPVEIPSYLFDPFLTWNNSWGLGLFYDDEDKNSFTSLLTFDGVLSAGNINKQLRCTELSSIIYKFKFEETDIRYKVNDEKDVYIYVNLYDDYVSFIPNTKDIESKVSNSLKNGYFILDPPNTNSPGGYTIPNGEMDEWTCVSHEGGVEDSSCVPK